MKEPDIRVLQGGKKSFRDVSNFNTILQDYSVVMRGLQRSQGVQEKSQVCTGCGLSLSVRCGGLGSLGEGYVHVVMVTQLWMM